jgi:hypothetical protein
MRMATVHLRESEWSMATLGQEEGRRNVSQPALPATGNQKKKKRGTTGSHLLVLPPMQPKCDQRPMVRIG